MFCNSIFTPAGRLCSKLQDYTATANTYAYSPNAKPHAVRRYYNGLTNELYNLRWDNNGNLAQQMVYSVANNATTYQGMRYLQWDEDDRLNLVAGDGYLSYYTYGHDGNRAIKMTGNAAIDQTGTLLNSTNLENITIYPNEYLTVTQAEYTKYYYAGGNRIASKIGTGGFEKMTRLCTLDQGPTYNANNLLNFVLYQVTNISNQPTDEYPVDVCGGYSVATELLADPLPDFYISQTNLNFTQNNLLQQFRQNHAGGTEPVYYFHGNHLGSANWVTTATASPTQFLLHLPYGEEFVKQLSGSYDERFTFTGKEKDIETGYYYFGARFDNVDLGFMSVDPMSDKYPSISPYAYCAWNPIKLVDEEGEEPIKSQAGTISGFVTFFNNTRTKMGTLKGAEAHNAMLRLGKTEWSWSSMRPMPATTNPFNNSKDKYIYTKEGGWIDMSHFMFYAGRAYEYKQNGEQYPMGKALKDGLFQEISDMFFAEHSAFSYEDLPSDKYGADFGANYFDPNSEQTFGEQLQNYFNEVLKATEPQNAPNYDNLPIEDTKKLPSRTNGSSFPVYTEQNP